VHVTRPIWDRAGLHRSQAFQRVPRIADSRAFNGTAADCRRFGLTPFAQRIGVYDMLLFDSELDMLEMHLQELAPVVTKFVIAESPVTFPGVPKPLHFGSIYRNQSHPEYERFRRFESQIVHVVVDRDRMLSLKGAWDREGFSRELLQQTLRTQTDMRAGDIIMSNDVDEIARASSVDLLRQCHFHASRFPVVFESQNFIYSFEFMDYRPAFNYAFKYDGNVCGSLCFVFFFSARVCFSTFSLL
jgi:beta-1,4-mannosyl-glycoprotein beta-1,4-N-acetylglucosaminyltransferase